MVMETTKYKKRGGNGNVKVSIEGKDRVNALKEINTLIPKGYGTPTYKGAVHWLIDKFIEDKISF